MYPSAIKAGSSCPKYRFTGIGDDQVEGMIDMAILIAKRMIILQRLADRLALLACRQSASRRVLLPKAAARVAPKSSGHHDARAGWLVAI